MIKNYFNFTMYDMGTSDGYCYQRPAEVHNKLLDVLIHSFMACQKKVKQSLSVHKVRTRFYIVSVLPSSMTPV